MLTMLYTLYINYRYKVYNIYFLTMTNLTPVSHKKLKSLSLTLLSSLSLSLIHLNTYALDKLKLDSVNKTLFAELVKMLDTNIGVFVLIASILGAVMRDGDLMQRAKASGVGSIGTLAIWGIAKKIVDI